MAVVGGKGGVGCTTIAVNLAAAIRSATGDATLLVDLHMAQGDTSVFLGVEPRFTVLDALENIHRLDDTYFRGLVTPTPSGVDLLASANRPVLGSIDVLRVQALLDFVTGAYPWVVIDCPRSDPSVIDALDIASTVVIVANQELADAAQRQPPGRDAAPALRRAAGQAGDQPLRHRVGNRPQGRRAGARRDHRLHLPERLPRGRRRAQQGRAAGLGDGTAGWR